MNSMLEVAHDSLVEETKPGLVSFCIYESEQEQQTFRFNPDDTASEKVFWGEYNNYVNTHTDGSLSFGERRRENGPLVIFMKLKYGSTSADCTRFALAATSVAQKTIIDCFRIDADYESAPELRAIVMNSDVFLESGANDYNSVSIRIQFPYCISSCDFFESVFRPAYIRNLRSANVLKYLEEAPIGDINDIVSTLRHDFVPLYGSRLPSTGLHEVFQFAVNYLELSVLDTDDYEQVVIDYHQLGDTEFDYTQHNSFVSGQMNITEYQEDYSNDSGDPFYYNLPLILSMNFITKCTQPNPVMTKLLGSEVKRTILIDDGIKDQVSKYKTLLKMISRRRAEHWPTAMNIGRAIYNLSPNYDKRALFDLFVSFVGDVGKTDQCLKAWNTFKYNNFNSHRVIEYYAEIDSPAQFSAWQLEQLAPELNSAIDSLSHFRIASVVKHVLSWRFVCANAEKRIWYVYLPKNHIWIKMDALIQLREYVSKGFVTLLVKYRGILNEQALRSNDQKEKDLLESRIGNCGALINKLGMKQFKSSVIGECDIHFHDPSFLTKMDSNPRVTGVLNGVIEIIDGKAIFREGHPDDYVTKQIKANVNLNLTPDDENVRAVQVWFRQVYNDPKLFEKFGLDAKNMDSELTQYVWNLHSSLLYGKNQDKKFMCNEGPSGDNSKSKVTSLVEMVFGDYCIKIPISVVTQNFRSGAAIPELAQAQGARVAFIDEPDEEDTIKGGILKILTGSDKMFLRRLHENGCNVEMVFKLFLNCNRIPQIPTGGKAVKNRLRAVPHNSQYVENAPIDELEQWLTSKFPRDNYFDEKIPNFLEAYLWIIMNNYENYARNGLQEPAVVAEYTANYWRENDIYNLYAKDRISLSVLPQPDSQGRQLLNLDKKVHKTQLYTDFKSWLQLEFENIKPPTSSTFSKEFMQRVPTQLQGSFYVGIELQVASRTNDQE